MRLIFSLSVIAALFYLLLNESPAAKTWFDKQRHSQPVVAVETKVSALWQQRLDAMATKLKQVQGQTLDEMQQQIASLQLQQRQLRQRLDQYAATDGVKQLAPGDQEVHSQPLAEAAKNSDKGYMSTAERRKQLLQMAQRLELQSLGSYH